jgi:expansin (peptidoglycan-binding protein)
VPVVFKNLIKAHFVSESMGERQIVFNINKDIIETIVDDMMYKVTDEADSDNENVQENLAFGNEVE